MLEVCSKKCGQCLFSTNRIVRKERVQEILAGCEKEDTHFICHKGTISNSHDNIVCKGFYDKKTSRLIRLAKSLRIIKFINPDTITA